MMNKSEVQDQVKRIADSVEFKNSSRLSDFLNYIVEEALAGRADRIKGLTVAQAVYSVGENFDPESNSIVRVEAGRLRRRIDKYYSTVGKNDPLLITIPKGSYAPAFSNNPNLELKEEQPPSDQRYGKLVRYRWVLVSAVILVVLLTWQMPGILYTPDQELDSGESASVQGSGSEIEIMFQQAFVLLMPPENNIRLETSRSLFQSLIDTEPDYAGGYAGKSLSYSIGVHFFKSEDTQKDLLKAITLARQAIELDPGFGLGHAALTLALSLDSKHDQALESARQAIAVPRRSALSDAMVSLALLNSGKPQTAVNLMSEVTKLNHRESRTPFLNILGIAQYVTGDYTAALSSFETNRAKNGPTGPHMDIYLAAAYAQLGQNFQAQAVFKRLRETNPDYPVEQWLAFSIKSSVELDATMDLLRSLES
jgi:tetratricopeptide (TPR) repeat protein